MSADLRIHIAPVGFEFLRVTEPLRAMRADKVYLVSHEKNDIAAEYYEKIKHELTTRYSHIQIEEVFLDIWDLYACIEKFRRIILQEEGNRVYVNVSTGTKITAIAGMLSCMMWDARPYYVPVSYIDRPKIRTEHVREPMDLPVYAINKPKSESMLILGMLRDHGGRMRKSLIIKNLEKAGVIRGASRPDVQLSSPAKHSRLRSLLDPMERHWNMISVRTGGRRSEVSIERQGEAALRIFGLDEASEWLLESIREEPDHPTL